MPRSKAEWNGFIRRPVWGLGLEHGQRLLNVGLEHEPDRRVIVRLPRQVLIWLIQATIRDQSTVMDEAVLGTAYERREGPKGHVMTPAERQRVLEAFRETRDN